PLHISPLSLHDALPIYDVALRSDREVAKLLLDLDVDIAVDLKGHTQHGRPAILAYRPAPVQVSYLGYPATMGVDFIDYVLADRRSEEHTSELQSPDHLV